MSTEHESTSKQQPLLVLGKITEILDSFSFDRPTMTLGEIHQNTGLPTSTVQRLVTNLVSQGFLDRNGDGIRIGIRMAYWAATARKDLDVLSIVNPVLKSIRHATTETVCFFRAEQQYRVCVAMAETQHALRREMYVGKVIPLSVGSAGRVILAYDDEAADRVLAGTLESMTEASITDADALRALLRKTRSDGYAITIGERESSASGLSAPVFDSASDIVGAVTISGPTLRMPLSRCEEWVDLLVSRAEQITRTLGGRYPI
ncbi:IclR family transcriptional regulator [Rhodococcus fascians]|nr:IclR family transcriptional regulator [Rhodococcus fascians]MBY4140886.1 IclR family transcriptional regulator [Rhodococcus fascians]MBY4219550.1 IclR family transcriptional regulator [Rhodococcus fascians]MBY4221859.1 IclR family transcriptional regulator [Rhodococcus fascians]MBY4233860.1 IclR family transcriptional regulator [Rhodococcus fascians]